MDGPRRGSDLALCDPAARCLNFVITRFYGLARFAAFSRRKITSNYIVMTIEGERTRIS